MGKKDKQVNPADALRKQQKKKELKKNKEDKKKGRLVATSQINTIKLEIEFQKLSEQEILGTIDANGKHRIRQIQDKIKEINVAREQLGLAPKELKLEDPAKNKSKKPEKVYKYYHPTFNPHGKRKGEDKLLDANGVSDDEVSDQGSVKSSNHSDLEITPNKSEQGIIDLSHIPIPEGIAPETDAQVYNTIKLDEIVDATETVRREKERAIQEQLQAQQQQEALNIPYMPQMQPYNPMIPPNYIPGMFPPGYPIPGMPFYPFHLQPPPMLVPQVGMPFTPFPGQFPNPSPFQSRPRQHHSRQSRPQKPQKPQKPVPLPNKPATANVISAAPQIRDLRKELTGFVPAAVLRKKALAHRKKESESVEPKE
ncbi:expressed protein [Batrachochytrium dendrobatidis JAM81]|uniref:Expressed protein n=1 Tax=Batrachochytrium dendrobatidis (strain JAM81 / FGSC 10211) TaxID=684364 RepID=F4P9V1_BATDJ|nr:uncharacterized protein BATDEDRAFT_91121 [Batrachochytrium dendrobatidis JAM81]EGF78006.1 expressed protein [Batrachochytrium dendrobatidis JAM81]|eukprot:XP_006681544.1 expressed protein [Batrachochytrium dendrobatidis JAM81]